MATSGSINFDQTVLEIITEAYALIRVGVEEEALTNSQAQEGRRALNTMFKSWNADGLHLWCKQEAVLFLVADQQKYQLGNSSSDHSALETDVVETAVATAASSGASSLVVDSITGIAASDNIGIELDDGTMQWTTASGAPSGSTITLADTLTDDVAVDNVVYAYTTKINRPTRVLQARHRNYDASDPTEIIMTKLERPDYFGLPNKSSDGTPTNFYYDRQKDEGFLYLWPTSDNAIDTVRFTVERPLEDLDTLPENVDFPKEWLLPLAFNLAYILSYRHSFPLAERRQLGADAMVLKEKLLGFDREYGSVFFQPDTQGSRR